MVELTKKTPMWEIEIFGIPALFAEQAPLPDELPPGLHNYDLISAEDGVTSLGTVLTLIPVEIPEDGGRDVYDNDLIMDTKAEMLTPEDFIAKYLSPVGGPDLDERYGKED